jgi:DNA-binding GntR family transcriptional regulator
MSDVVMHQTMASRVESAIRKDIVSGLISPGERLRVADLSMRYGVSHIPVREALRQLEGDRLVVIDPHKGAILRVVTPKFVRDMHDTRAALEMLLVRNAAERADSESAARLRQLARDYEMAAAAGEASETIQANLALHRAIAAMADNPIAADILEQGWELVVAIRSRYGFGPSRIAAIVEQHRLLVDAIITGKKDDAVEVAFNHCVDARDDLLARMGASDETA